MNQTYAVIENEIVVNIVVATAEFASQFANWVLLQEGYGIGDLYKNGNFEHPPEPQPE